MLTVGERNAILLQVGGFEENMYTNNTASFCTLHGSSRKWACFQVFNVLQGLGENGDTFTFIKLHFFLLKSNNSSRHRNWCSFVDAPLIFHGGRDRNVAKFALIHRVVKPRRFISPLYILYTNSQNLLLFASNEFCMIWNCKYQQFEDMKNLES